MCSMILTYLPAGRDYRELYLYIFVFVFHCDVAAFAVAAAGPGDAVAGALNACAAVLLLCSCCSRGTCCNSCRCIAAASSSQQSPNKEIQEKHGVVKWVAVFKCSSVQGFKCVGGIREAKQLGDGGFRAIRIQNFGLLT